MLEKGSELYMAIEESVIEIFDGEIPLDDPFETTEKLVESIKKYMGAC